MNDHTPAAGQSEHNGQALSVAPRSSIDAACRVTWSVAGAAAQAGLGVEEIVRPLEVVGSGDEAMRHLDGAVVLLREVHRAKAGLHKVASTKLRAALELRAGALKGARA